MKSSTFTLTTALLSLESSLRDILAASVRKVSVVYCRGESWEGKKEGWWEKVKRRGKKILLKPKWGARKA